MPVAFTINPRSGYPVYLQIVEQVQRAVAIGALAAGEQLPTVKQLARDLVVNPSTVAKALRDLEHLGVITTIHGRGSYVSEHAKAVALQQTAELTVVQALERAVDDAHALGLSGEALQHLFDRVFSARYVTDPNGEPVQ